jgi:hypothetical protein
MNRKEKGMRSSKVTGTFSLLLPVAIAAQGLFESAGNVGNDSAFGDKQPKAVVINGYAKGAFFGGRDNADKTIVSGSYAQTALKLNAEKSGLGRTFAEVRLNAGFSRGSPITAFDVREAWAAVSSGMFDVRLGRQIISWGRADAINPTSTITPKDETVLSSEFDDTRLGNELIQAKVKIGPSSVQGIWIPYYRPDVLPIAGAKIPSGITIGDPIYPDNQFKNGGYALRLECTLSSVDGSLSYFNGFGTLPGLDFTLSQTGLSLFPHAYRMQAGGADFSTAIGPFGVRGEAAIKYPFDDYEEKAYVPNPYAQYVLGLDKTMGNVSVLAQYCGFYTIHFKEIEYPVLTDPFDPIARAQFVSVMAANEIERMNRLFNGTSDKISHSLVGNAQWNALYETLHLKLAGMYNFTTEDYAVNPSASYDIADAVSLIVGGRYIDGPEGNLNNMISNLMSFVYTDLKVSF